MAGLHGSRRPGAGRERGALRCPVSVRCHIDIRSISVFRYSKHPSPQRARGASMRKSIMRPALLSTTNHVHSPHGICASQALSISSRLKGCPPTKQPYHRITDRPGSPARAAESGSEYYEGHSSAPFRTPRPQLHIGPHMTSVASPRYNVRASPFAFSSDLSSTSLRADAARLSPSDLFLPQARAGLRLPSGLSRRSRRATLLRGCLL